MACVDTAKIIQGLTVLTISPDLPLMAKHCKSCKTSALSLQLNMDQMENTAAQRSRLKHSLIRLCVIMFTAWLIEHSQINNWSISLYLTRLVDAMQIQQASTLLIGCPACDHNFKHFFCTLTCHPDQSTFVNVTDVQLSADTNETAVAQVCTNHFILCCSFNISAIYLQNIPTFWR